MSGITTLQKMVVAIFGVYVVLAISPKLAVGAPLTDFHKDLATAYKAVLASDGSQGLLADRAARAERGIVDPPLEPATGFNLSISTERWSSAGYSASQTVSPNEIRHPEITFRQRDPAVEPESIPEMAWTRKNLILALAKGARHSHSPQSAKAQAFFDCWVLSGNGACASNAKILAAGLAESLKEKPFFIETIDSPWGQSCHDTPHERRYSFGGYDQMTPSIAEALDRARMESTAQLACFETEN